MRTEQIWDKWVTYDDDGFINGIMPEAPDDVKKAYADYIAEREKQAENGCITK